MAAADAHRLRLAGGIVLLVGETQQGVGVLHHRGLQVPLHRPGHGTAGEDDRGLLPQAAGRLQQAAQGGPDGNPEIPGPGHRAAAYRHRPVGQGAPLHQGGAHHIHRGHVEYGAFYIQRRLAGRYLTPGHGADQLLFHAQGIAGLDGEQLHRPLLPAQAALQKLHRVELVSGHDQNRPLHPEQPGHHLHPLEDLVPLLQQQPVVGGQIGLALGGVDDQGVHPAHRLAQAQVGGAGAAPHAGDPRPADPVQGLVPVHPGPVHRLRQIGTGGVLPVVVDDDGVPASAPGMGSGLDGAHPAGDAGVDIDAAALRLSDDLTHRHRVPGPDNRDRSAAAAHGKGNDHLLGRLLQGDDGLASGALFIGSGVYPAQIASPHGYLPGRATGRPAPGRPFALVKFRSVYIILN